MTVKKIFCGCVTGYPFSYQKSADGIFFPLRTALARTNFFEHQYAPNPQVSLPPFSIIQVSVQRPNEIVRQDGKSVPLLMSIEEISFSAHSDFAQTKEFVSTIDVNHVVPGAQPNGTAAIG